MFNKIAFESITDELTNRLIDYRESNPELKTIIRDAGNGFYSVFKDSLFEYNDGIILLERLYKPTSVKYDSYSQSYLDEDDKALIRQLEEESLNTPSTSELTPEESDKKLKSIEELCKKVSNIKPKYKDSTIEYIETALAKIYLKSLGSLSDNEIASRAVLSASLALTMYQSLFLVNEFEEGMSVLGIDQGEYLDIVVLPYSSETNKEETIEETNKKEEE